MRSYQMEIYMAHQYSRVGFNSSVEVNEVNLSVSYGGVGKKQARIRVNWSVTLQMTC